MGQPARRILAAIRNETAHLIDAAEEALEDEVEAIGRFVKRVSMDSSWLNIVDRPMEPGALIWMCVRLQ